MPAYKNRVWDGKIRLFDVRTNELPVGLFPFLEEFAKPRNYPIIVEHDNYYGRPDATNAIDPDKIMEFIKMIEPERE